MPSRHPRRRRSSNSTSAAATVAFSEFDARLHGNGEAQAGAGQEVRRQAGTLGADGEDQGAGEVGAIEILAFAGDQSRPARSGGVEVAGEGVRLHRYCDRETQEAARRGSQSPRVVRMDAARGEGEAHGTRRLGHPARAPRLPGS